MPIRAQWSICSSRKAIRWPRTSPFSNSRMKRLWPRFPRRAPASVAKVHVKSGDKISVGQKILTLSGGGEASGKAAPSQPKARARTAAPEPEPEEEVEEVEPEETEGTAEAEGSEPPLRRQFDGWPAIWESISSGCAARRAGGASRWWICGRIFNVWSGWPLSPGNRRPALRQNRRLNKLIFRSWGCDHQKATFAIAPGDCPAHGRELERHSARDTI